MRKQNRDSSNFRIDFHFGKYLMAEQHFVTQHHGFY